MSCNCEHDNWIDGREVRIRDGDGGLFVPLNVVPVQHVVHIKFALNFSSEPSNSCDFLPRPHFHFRLCVDGVECLQFFSLGSDDYLMIIIWVEWSIFYVVPYER